MALLINGDIQHFAMGVPAIQHASGSLLNSSPLTTLKIFDYRSGKYPIGDVYLYHIADDYIISCRVCLFEDLSPFVRSSILKTT